MHQPKHTYLDIRMLYATNPDRQGAYFLRRHRISLMRESPATRNPELLGTAIVEVLNLYEYEFHKEFDPELIFDIDRCWRNIGRLMYDHRHRNFQPDIIDQFESANYLPNLAFLRHLRLQQPVRGSGLGRWFLKQIIRHFQDTCGLMVTFTEGAPVPAVLAYPVLPDHWSLDEPLPLRRLCRGLELAGFHPIGRTHLYVADLHSSRQYS